MARVRRLTAVLAAFSRDCGSEFRIIVGRPREEGQSRHAAAREQRQTSRPRGETGRGRRRDGAGPVEIRRGGAAHLPTHHGDAYFALQVKPSLTTGPRRPRDYLLLVSADASQAGPSWFAAHQITAGILKEAAPGDRVSLWMVSTPEERFTCSLTKGFVKVKDSAKVFQAALNRLREQYPAGDTDLKYALTKAVNSFEGQANRQRVLVYLGNGMSTHAPLTAADRSA